MVNAIPLLNKIGLTEAESKTYLSLLRYGSSSGYEVSKVSGVPRSKIYNILETLVTKGFVRFTEGEGTNQYLAVPIEEVSERIQKETKDTLEELTAQLKEYQRVQKCICKMPKYYSAYGRRTAYSDMGRRFASDRKRTERA